MATATAKVSSGAAILGAIAIGAATLLTPNPNTVHISWINPTTRVNGVALPRKELRGVRIYVDDVLTASIGGSRVDIQKYDLTLKCYKPGRRIDMTAVDITGLEGPHSPPQLLQPKDGTTCK